MKLTRKQTKAIYKRLDSLELVEFWESYNSITETFKDNMIIKVSDELEVVFDWQVYQDSTVLISSLVVYDFQSNEFDIRDREYLTLHSKLRTLFDLSYFTESEPTEFHAFNLGD